MKDYGLWFWQLESLPSLLQITKQICNISLPWMTNLNSTFQSYTTHHASLFLQNTVVSTSHAHNELQLPNSIKYPLPTNTGSQTCSAALSKQQFNTSEAFWGLYLNCTHILSCHQHIAASFYCGISLTKECTILINIQQRSKNNTATAGAHCNVNRSM
jgi:hypothetical protein